MHPYRLINGLQKVSRRGSQRNYSELLHVHIVNWLIDSHVIQSGINFEPGKPRQNVTPLTRMIRPCYNSIWECYLGTSIYPWPTTSGKVQRRAPLYSHIVSRKYIHTVRKRYTHSHAHFSCLASAVKSRLLTDRWFWLYLPGYQLVYCASRVLSAQKVDLSARLSFI